eukprot:6175930-Pleurochrysis_carterae.AAC.1
MLIRRLLVAFEGVCVSRVREPGPCAALLRAVLPDADAAEAHVVHVELRDILARAPLLGAATPPGEEREREG